MWRGALKAAGLGAFGRVPGGPHLYRRLTREIMGTAGSHVDKLQRVWPGYVGVWQEHCGLELEGLDLLIHDGGRTPFSLLACYLLTGKGGIMTSHEGPVLDRYLARTVNGVLATAFPDGLVPLRRRRQVEPLRWVATVQEAVAAVGGRLIDDAPPNQLPLPSASIDLCHSGGALEHYCLDALDGFLREQHRILRPGGVASHVFDHRDHLHHADPRWPFLGHLALGDAPYRALMGHPLLFHNRLSPDQVCERFMAAGFELVAVRRLILPARRYVDSADEACRHGRPGLPRQLLAARFRSLSDADLRTAAAHYLFRKPSDPDEARCTATMAFPVDN